MRQSGRVTAHLDGDYTRPQVNTIEYELLDSEDAPTAGSSIDQVSMAVRLRFSDGGSIRIHGNATLPIERITIGERQSGDPTSRTRTVDVTSRWPEFAGDALLHYRFSLQEGVDGPEPWSCRLVFLSGRNLVIALGELNGREISYLPDCLVVTADRDVAENYQPLRAWDNAWGSDPTVESAVKPGETAQTP